MRRTIVGVALLAVVAAGASVAWAAQRDDVLDAPGRETSVVATPTATLSCPESPADKQTETSLLAVAPVEQPGDPAPSAEGEGRGEAQTLRADGATRLGRLDGRGSPLVREVGPSDDPSVVVRASGGLAPGLAAAQWSTATKDAGSGLAVSGCAAAAEAWWFSGVTTAVGATSRLVVSNPTPAVAVYHLRFFGPDGEVEAVGARDLPLAPMSRESLDLARFAPGVEDLTVEVEVVSGRIAAAVHTDVVTGADPAGSEWVAPTQPPATEVLVNAGFADDTEAELQVTNPTDAEALVQVQVVDEGGPFAPTTLQDLRVPPGAVISRSLTAVNEDAATAVHLTSSVEVVAAVAERSDQAADIAVAGAGPELDAPAVVPLIDGHDLTIAFSSAVRVAGDVTLTAYDDRGDEVDREDVNVKGFTTSAWEPSAKAADRAAYIVVSADPAGRTHAAAQYSADDAIASMPVVPGVYTLTRPSVLPAAP
jgi:hypothetical protein